MVLSKDEISANETKIQSTEKLKSLQLDLNPQPFSS